MPTDLTMTYPQPFPPNVIQIGPLHLKEAKPLSKDLEDWISNSEDGIVYFSLGTNMKGTSLEKEKREAFVKAFGKFPKIRFLWKWESDEPIPGLSRNVLTRKWFPQQDIFAHPKLRLFITQGGLQSSEEIIHHGIPILGIPIVGDQKRNIGKFVKEGAGISLEISKITGDSVYSAINTLLYQQNQVFKENAERLSRIAKDQLVPALDTSVWWVEYIIRHNGARHLRMASFDLSWYQLWLIDVHILLLAIILISLFTLHFITKTILKLFKRKPNKGKIIQKDVFKKKK